MGACPVCTSILGCQVSTCTNYSLALSHLLSSFLSYQTPASLFKQLIIPENSFRCASENKGRGF